MWIRPPLSVAGTRWTRWTPLSNFSLANTPWPRTEATTSLIAADVGRAGRDELDLPALGLGIALVHPEQVAGEQGGLVAAGAGADLEHRRPLVGGVAGQQLERQRALGLGQPRLQVGKLLAGHLADLGARIGQHLGEQLDLGADPPDLARGDGDRLDLGIILGKPDELVGREAARRHRILKLVAPRLDGGDPFGRDARHRARTASARSDDRHAFLLAVCQILHRRLAAAQARRRRG